MTMTEKNTKPAARPPMGFSIVPPHLVAINMLTHIERMANGQRSKTIHATSRKRHKFKKLTEDILEWRKNPARYLQEITAASTEWRPAGIREITDKPGHYMFSRAILTPLAPPQLVVPAKMLVQKRLDIPSQPRQPRIRTQPKLTVGTQITAPSETTNPPARAPPARPSTNAFFTLDASNRPNRNWANRTRATTLPIQQSSESETDASPSPNLLDSAPPSHDEEDHTHHEDQVPKAVPPTAPPETGQIPETQTIANLRSEILTLRTMLQSFQTQIDRVQATALASQTTLATTDILELRDNMHTLKRKCVQHEDYDVDHATLKTRLSNVETRTTQQWITKADLEQHAQVLDQSMMLQLQTTITARMHTDSALLQTLRTRINDELTHLKDIEELRETVVDELNDAFETLRDELGKEVRENTMDELYDDLKQDASLQTTIHKLIQEASDPDTLQTALGPILDNQLMDIQFAIQAHIDSMTDDGIQKIDAAMTLNTERGIQLIDTMITSRIPAQVQTIVAAGIQEIDSVIKGTTDQAVEIVMLATRSDTTAPTARHPEPIPVVTPQRTFRGINVRIDESPTPISRGNNAFKDYMTKHQNPPPPSVPAPRYSQYEDSRTTRSRSTTRDEAARPRPNNRDDEYGHREPDEFSRRDQEYFMKGYIEASLDTLREDDMIIWYKSVDSYCTLHSVPLLSFQQVTKGVDLYPPDAPSDLRERFSRMLSIKLNQSSLIKDPIAKSIINARAGRDDGYGALYALLAASIPRLQVHKIVPSTGSNKPPIWDPTLMNVYHYESKIHDYIEHQATKQRFYSDREATQFFLEGLATDESKRFASALAKALDKLEKTPEDQALPMDYRLGQIAQTIAELALSDHEVGTDALTIIGDATVRTTIGDATVNYTRSDDKGKGKDDQQRRKRFRRPKLDIQCPGCKLWGHDDTTCDFLARTLFALDYTKKQPDKAEKIAEAFCRKNTKEAKAFIKTLSAFPAASRPPSLPSSIEPESHYDDDDDDGADYFVEDFLGSMISGFGLSIRTAAASSTTTEQNKALLEAVDPLALQCIQLPPYPSIAPPSMDSADIADPDQLPTTIPVVCTINSHATPAQADSGANRAITDNLSLLHHMRQLEQPFPVGSIDSGNKIHCTAIGELHLLTEEGTIEQFPCFYCAQSAGTVISPDHKCTTSSHITKWEQDGDTRTGRGAIRFRNPQDTVVATLPTYRRNGLWYTELSAVPSTPDATVRTLQVPPMPFAIDPLYSSALTDSDRHHYTPSSTTTKIHRVTDDAIIDATPPTELLVEDPAPADAGDIIEDGNTVEENDPAPPTVTPYSDPYIPPPDEPPPKKSKHVSFQSSHLRSQDPQAPHIEDIHKTSSKRYRPSTPRCRDWNGLTPPVPKQAHSKLPAPSKPAPGGQLLTELWHHRMGHPGTDKLRKTQHHTTGIPTLGPLHPLFGCHNCDIAKMTKQARGKTDAGAAHHKGERFHMDYGFFRGPAHLANHVKRKHGNMTLGSLPHKPILTSREGYAAYLLIVDSKTRHVWAFNTKTKEPPIQTVDLFLQRYGLKDGTQRYIRTDLGGELANSQDFRTLIAKHGYLLETTGPDASSQNGRGERPHRTLANMVRCMLYSASLGAEFWADALVHATYLYNRTYHRTIGKTPHEAWTDKIPDLRHIRTFGSSVTVRKPGRRPTKNDPHCYHGIFLRFTSTTRNIIYYDINSKRTKTATHKALDEFHYGNSPASRPLMAQHLIDLAADDKTKKSEYGRPLPLEEFVDLDAQPTRTAAAAATLEHPAHDDAGYYAPADEIEPHDDVDFADDNPATINTIYEPATGYHAGDINNIEMSMDIFGPSTTEPISLDTKHPTLGFIFSSPQGNDRPIIQDCQSGTPAAKIRNWRSRFRYGSLRAINGQYLDNITNVHRTIAQLHDANAKTCTITIAHPEIAQPLTASGIPQLHFDQLHAIAHHLHVIRYGEDYDLWGNTADWPHVDEETIHQAIIDDQVPVKFTRRKLKIRDDWPVWKAAEWKQLLSYQKQDMFGAPIRRPPKATVLPFVWTYLFKDGTQPKARGTCNGGKRYGRAVTLAHTYASCVEQPGARIFWSLAALHGMTALGADAGNAFAEAPPPVEPFYMEIDEQFRTWWTESLGLDPIPAGFVLPVKHALQGHPEAPRLWEKHIVKILANMGFKSTTHEKCIYQKTIDGEKVLFLRQVDDFAVACCNPAITKEIIRQVGVQLTVPLHDLGVLTKFNGVNILQTRDYIKIHCESFLDKVLTQHGWQEDIKQHNPIPMRNDTAYQAQMEAAELPATESERKQLHNEFFNYRQCIGEAIYAMTVARPDIAFAVIKLSQYSANPAKIHYQALRHLFKYLALTKTRGIYFWRKIPVPDLPVIPAEHCVSHSEILHSIPKTKQPHRMHAFVDSDWGSDRSHRRSVTGLVVMLAGGVIAYKSKYQATIALSSTEAEFTAAAEVGKITLYLRSILYELGFSQDLPTIIYEDNTGALHMANAQQPTRRTRHMDTKHFAIQDWVAHDQIDVAPIATANNISDAFTKALGRIKFYEQTDVIMGRRIPPYVPQWIRTDHPKPQTTSRSIPSSKPRLLSILDSLPDLLPTSFFKRLF
jgi:hypothetical protein